MTRPIYIIAADIRRHWSPVNYAAKPYLEGMRSLDRISDTYGADSGRSLVAYFLNNASGWRGDEARRITAELRAMLAA